MASPNAGRIQLPALRKPPRNRARLELLISLDAPGEIARRLPEASRGMLVDLEGPMGTFTFPESPTQQRLLFVAGGTGIAPLRAMIDHAIRHHRH